MKYILDKFRKCFLDRALKKLKKLIDCAGDELMDDFLELLLKVFRLVFCLNLFNFKENIEGFEATYAFKSRNEKIGATAIFTKNKMKVKNTAVEPANVTIIFKDGKSLWEFLMGGSPDIFDFVLKGKLSYKGNLNYLLRFAYLAIHLQKKFEL